MAKEGLSLVRELRFGWRNWKEKGGEGKLGLEDNGREGEGWCRGRRILVR